MNQWNPQHYDPGAHQRRLDDGVLPQGYGQQQYQQRPDPRDGRHQPPPYAGQWPPRQPPQFQRQPPRRKRGGAGKAIAAIIGAGIAVFIIVAALASHAPQPSPAATSFPAAAPAATQVPSPAAASTITFVTSGSLAQVTYGDAGSSLAGKVPMRLTGPLGNPLYYNITAQLQGSGSVTCKILIGGQVISQATATGGYNIALCEISKDPLSGQWQDTNDGA